MRDIFPYLATSGQKIIRESHAGRAVTERKSHVVTDFNGVEYTLQVWDIDLSCMHLFSYFTSHEGMLKMFTIAWLLFL